MTILVTIARYLYYYAAFLTHSCQGYQPEARGYVVYSPRALPEAHHELKADKRLIFTLARIPQGMQKSIEEKCHYCSSVSFAFHPLLALVAFTSF